LAVDTLGYPVFTHCTKANVSDDVGLVEMLVAHRDYFKHRPVELGRLTILLDNGYHPECIKISLQQDAPELLAHLDFKVTPKPTKTEKTQKGISGFMPVHKRWIVERSNAWMERCKALIKNFELTLDRAVCKIHLCFIRLALKAIVRATK